MVFAEWQKRSKWITRIAGMACAALAATIGFGAFLAFKPGASFPGAVLPTGQFTITSATPVALVVACVLLALLLLSPLTKRQQ